MTPDLCALVRRDHDDLDRALAVMADPNTATDELVAMLDVFKLALAVHTSAEAKVFDTLREAVAGPYALQLICEQSEAEHRAQHLMVDVLTATRPGTEAWYAGALELRVLVLDHARRAELARWTLQDHVPAPLHRALGRDYATERMRVLARTSPVAFARAQMFGAAVLPVVIASAPNGSR